MTGYIDPRGKLYAHLPKLAALQEGRVVAPINVEVDVSFRCQLGCEFCHFAFTHTRGPLAGKQQKPAGAVSGGDLMNTEFALRMVEQFAAAGVESISWTGGGEPTLHPDFAKIIEHTAATGLAQGVYTNAANLKDETVAALKRHMTFVYVSLDAVDAASYKKHKGVDRFNQACEGIKRLVAAPGDATVGVGFLLGESNWQDAYGVGDLVAELGADYGQLRPIILYEQNDPGVASGNVSWVDSALGAVRIATERDTRIEADMSRFSALRDWDGHGYKTCWWSALQTVVTPNGKMWTCVNKREHPAALIGDLLVESFTDLWTRRPLAKVNGDCRIMCRGHIANTELDRIMAPRPHAAFI